MDHQFLLQSKLTDFCFSKNFERRVRKFARINLSLLFCIYLFGYVVAVNSANAQEVKFVSMKSSRKMLMRTKRMMNNKMMKIVDLRKIRRKRLNADDEDKSFYEEQIDKYSGFIDDSQICESVKRLVKASPSAKCDNSATQIDKDRQLNINVYKTSPGEKHYRVDIIGSSELLAINKADGTESHKYDIIFMLDFDFSLHVNVHDLEARINYRMPKQVKEADWKLMERENDTQNADFISRLASRIASDLGNSTNSSVNIILPNN